MSRSRIRNQLFGAKNYSNPGKGQINAVEILFETTNAIIKDLFVYT